MRAFGFRAFSLYEYGSRPEACSAGYLAADSRLELFFFPTDLLGLSEADTEPSLLIEANLNPATA